MSFSKKICALTCIALATITTGCKDSTPSSDLVKDYLYKTVNSYDLYQQHFNIESWEKTNGWKDGDDYIVSANVNLKSKISYINLLSDCAVASAPSLKGSWAERSSLDVLAMQANASGLGKQFVEYWNNGAAKTTWPKELQDVAQHTNKDEWDTLMKACDNHILTNYGEVIDRTLSPSTKLVRTYKLKFKNTEKGWMGLDS